MLVHGTLVSLNEAGILLQGPPGSGKSDLALRLMSLVGGHLVADDQVILVVQGKQLIGTAPDELKGLIEVHGLGIVHTPHHIKSTVDLVIHLSRVEVERLPEPKTEEFLGVKVPALTLDPGRSSALAKLQVAVSVIRGKTKPHTTALDMI